MSFMRVQLWSCYLEERSSFRLSYTFELCDRRVFVFFNFVGFVEHGKIFLPFAALKSRPCAVE